MYQLEKPQIMPLCILLIWSFSAFKPNFSFPSQHGLPESFLISADISTDTCQTMRDSVWKLTGREDILHGYGICISDNWETVASSRFIPVFL